MTFMRFSIGGSYDPATARDFAPRDDGILVGGLTVANDGNFFTYRTTGIVEEYYSIPPESGTVTAEDGYDGDTSERRYVDARSLTDGLYVNATGFTFANLTGGAVGDVFIGSENADTLNGGGGDDRLSGAGGDDILIGGAGADALDGGDGFDIASYATATAGIRVYLYDPGAGANDSYGDTYTNIEGLVGTAYGDTLLGDDDDNYIDGGAGGDNINGGDGNDTIAFASIANEPRSDYGGTLDSITGGSGYDIARFSFTGDARLLGSGSTANLLTTDYSGMAYIDTTERLEIALGSQTLYLGGLQPQVVITGDSGDSIVRDDGMSASTWITFDGGGGDDSYQAGRGLDYIVFSGTGDAVVNFSNASVTVDGLTYDSGAARDGYGGRDTYLTPINIERVTTGAGNDTLFLSFRGTMASTGDGDDTIYSSLPSDSIDGGNGTDTVSYAYTGFGVVVSLGGKSGPKADLAIAGGATFERVENLAGSLYDDTLTGDFGDNVLNGNGGNDTLNWSGGNDTFIGDGTGDTLSFARVFLDEDSDGVTVSLAADGAQDLGDIYGGVTLSGIANLTGTMFDDILSGDATANVLRGGYGDDVLNGGAGADSLYGDDGIDTVSYAGASGRVTVNLANASLNTGDAAGDTYESVERIVGSGYGDSLRGNTKARWIDGGAGDDVIAVSATPTLIDGGAGTGDRLVIRVRASVRIADAQMQGIETISVRDGATADFHAYTRDLGAVRSLSTAASGVTIVGGAGKDQIFQGAGADHLSGGGGDDAITITNDRGMYDGGDGVADLATITGPGAAFRFDADTFTGFENVLLGTGTTTDFTGVTGPLVVTARGAIGVVGGSGDDRITGSGLADRIDGGAGADILAGRDGDDTFVFRSLAEMSNAAGATDRVNDFQAHGTTGHGDTIDLSMIDADPSTPGIDRFAFLGTEAFSETGVAEVRIKVGGAGNSFIQFDADGDGLVDASFLVHSTGALTRADFFLGTELTL